ncbi:hypothetical protein P4679_33885, partial [Priestia megaterium]|uniref:hypothetical protein n=1 Tax=Priestia megaterium TaxID=1404 RepID=UPI002E1AFF9C|nr:hypothetical protein [Priestia megaterium]
TKCSLSIINISITVVVITREENQNLLRVIAVVMIIEKGVIITEVMDIIIIREKERVEVSLVVK